MKKRVSVAMILAAAGAACAQPANDACSAAMPISGVGLFPFDNNLATTDGIPDPLCNFFSSSEIYNDVWYCWTPSQAGPVLARTCTFTTLDSKIAVYDGCSCPSGTAILTCSDDNCGTQTVVSWNAQAGHTYLIRVGSYSQTAFGAGSIEITSAITAGPFVNPANSHSYYLLAPGTWTGAEAAAISLGGHLVTMNDAAENEWVRANVLMFDNADRRGWIGLNDVKIEGNYVWTSGEPLGFTNWSGGEPNNSGGVEDWIEMFGNGLWNDNTNAPAGLLVYGLVEVAPSSCYANCDGSTGTPKLTGNDFVCFINAYAASQPYANCDGSTGTPALTGNDFVCFVNRYASGCT